MAVPCEMLLHPELLSNEQLLHIILERHLGIPNLECFRRDELLDIFHHYCVPYGQRKHRDSGRGKIQNKTRHKSPEPSPKLNGTNTNNTVIRKSQIGFERLKPPPDILSGHMKRIKIEYKSTVLSTDINNMNVINKRKIPLDCPSAVVEGPPAKKDRKLITWP